jgi:hypothetical protein
MMLVSKELNSHPKRLRTGQYDSEILCADCDNKFSPWENYTAKLLMTAGAYERYREAKPGEDFYRIPEYDYASLKLCLLSILWRMSISNLPSFRRIALGPFEAVIRRMLVDKNPGRTDEFPVFIVRLKDEVGSGTAIPFAKLLTCSGLAALRLAAFGLGPPLTGLLPGLGRTRARRSKWL